jgi:hypothetical protein
LGQKGRNLMIQMLRLEDGVSFLDEINWLKPEIERWTTSMNRDYVANVENILMSVLNSERSNPYGHRKKGSVRLE